MSINPGLSSDPDRQCKNSVLHRRNNSGELDVFEASRYFSSANDSSLFSPNFIGDQKRLQGQRAARMSLDMPMIKNPMISSDNINLPLKESKKWKQPSSPGGRLASFLNSLFSQTASKKKKKSKSKKDTDEEIQGGRKRRSSISHFRITTSDSGKESKSIYAKTPTKLSCKELESLSDHQKVCKKEEFRFSHGNGVKNGSFRNCTVICDGDEEERGFRKFSDVDNGADSDSSSDLFDLPNYDLDLPVYGTTNMDRIRIAVPI